MPSWRGLTLRAGSSSRSIIRSGHYWTPARFAPTVTTTPCAEHAVVDEPWQATVRVVASMGPTVEDGRPSALATASAADFWPGW